MNIKIGQIVRLSTGEVGEIIPNPEVLSSAILVKTSLGRIIPAVLEPNNIFSTHITMILQEPASHILPKEPDFFADPCMAGIELTRLPSWGTVQVGVDKWQGYYLACSQPTHEIYGPFEGRKHAYDFYLNRLK